MCNVRVYVRCVLSLCLGVGRYTTLSRALEYTTLKSLVEETAIIYDPTEETVVQVRGLLGACAWWCCCCCYRCCCCCWGFYVFERNGV